MGRLIVALAVSLWIVPISILVNRIVPLPYMDEIFHIPQAQQYCKGNFWTWDPMITTPPGLYYLSLPFVASLFPGLFMLQKAITFYDACSTTLLRSTNYVLAIVCNVVIYELISHLRPALDERKKTVFAVVLALYPLHWFFTFLYYTDVASLTAVLSMYLMCLKKSYRFSALLGVVAIAIRQTNVVWVVFTTCAGIINVTMAYQIQCLKDCDTSSDKKIRPSTNKHGEEVSNLRRRKSGKIINISEQRDSTKVSIPGRDFAHEVHSLLLSIWHLKWELMVSFGPFILVILAFLAFLWWNGSIVLGAKDAHTVSLHFPQMLYFGLVSSLLSALLIFNPKQVAEMATSLQKNVLIKSFGVLLLLIFGVLAVHFFSIAHPYLLSDNRHYTFYLWRRVIGGHWSIKYLLVPLYILSWLSILSILRNTQTRVWTLAYFLATAAVLVPAPLIEFRYYTIPFYIVMLHTPVGDYRSWILIGASYTAINAFTIWMFLFRPFTWDHEKGTQRFIW